MAQHISFPDIGQLRNVCKFVRERGQFHQMPRLPVLEFTGTVKLHGTNAGFVYDARNGEAWCQSRSQVVTRESDNAGFAAFCHDRMVALTLLAQSYIHSDADGIAIFGEWCGKGIQKGVAINLVEKMFVIFGARVLHKINNPESWSWLGSHRIVSGYAGSMPLDLHAARIFNVFDIPGTGLPQFEIVVDMNEPALAQNRLVEMTMGVETRCPFGAALGVDGVGEGIVWKCTGSDIDVPFKLDDLWFKTKGEKHSESKVTTLASFDVERVQGIRALCDVLLTEHRLEKALCKFVEQGGDADVKSTGKFIAFVNQDLHKEELDTVVENGFEWGDVVKTLTARIRTWFLEQAQAV